MPRGQSTLTQYYTGQSMDVRKIVLLNSILRDLKSSRNAMRRAYEKAEPTYQKVSGDYKEIHDKLNLKIRAIKGMIKRLEMNAK